MTDVIFLPGIVAPAAFRYAALLEHLPKDVKPVLKDLEVYAGDSPPPRYSIETEVQGIDGTADKAGLERFHIQVNNRLVLTGLLDELELAGQTAPLLRALDKLAKVGREGVASARRRRGPGQNSAHRVP